MMPPRPRARLWVAAATALALPACGALRSTSDTSSVAAPVDVMVAPLAAPSPAVTPAPHTRWLVWGVRGSGSTESHLVEVIGDEVRAIGHADGAWTATRHGLWSFEVDATELALPSCEALEADPGDGSATGLDADAAGSADGGVGRFEVAFAKEASSSEAVEMVSAPDTEWATELDHHAELTTSLGPYLFVREGVYSYSCGAHGNYSASFRLWDLERRRPADELLAMTSSRLASGERRAASAALAELGLDGPPSPADVELAAMDMAFDPAGAVRLDLLFVTSSCYACSNGEWSSYSSGAWVAARDVPTALASQVPPPLVARAVATALEGLELRGFASAPRSDRLDGELRQVFEATLD